jgi:teichuronic acid biosynthesis glycosyltransferase TuaC
LVGEGPNRPDLEKQARELNIQTKVHFEGYIPHSKVASYLQKADLFCLSSFSEGLPGVILEAMACGLPVVATNVGGVSEAVVNGVTGILVESGNLDAFVNAMQIALSSNWDPESIRKVVLSKFTWQRNAELMKKLYESVI